MTHSNAGPTTNIHTRSSERAQEALRIAHASELTDARLKQLSDPLRKVALWLYQPTTEFIVASAILISVGFALYEVLASPNPLSFGGSPTQSVLASIPVLFWFDLGLSVFFVAEYVLRITIAPHTWTFVKTHLIDLIALLPVLRIFRMGRLLRLLRVLRVLRILRIRSLTYNPVSELWAAIKPSTGEQTVVFGYLGFSLVLGTTGIMIFERNAASGFDSVSDAVWWALVTITTVGYGDIAPVTAGGRIVGGFLMVVGLSFYGVITGMISSSLIERTRNRREGELSIQDFSEHLLVCGWTEDTQPLLEDVSASHEYDGLVVITEQKLDTSDLPDDVLWVSGDPTEIQTLERANVAHARSAIILAETSRGMTAQDVDARSILVAIATKHINPHIHLLVQLLRETNRAHCQTAGVDEVIVASQFDGTVLRKSARYPGTSKLYSDFLGTDSDTSLHFMHIDDTLAGMPFVEASQHLITEQQGIPIGFRRNGKRLYNPDADVILESGDKLMVIRQHE